MGRKYVDHSWDFREADTKIYTHCFHAYPAMMIPQVAGRLIDTFGKKAKRLFDPYCGTGTSLVEANLRGVMAIGSDINPLARLIAKAKTTCISLQTLDLYLKDYNDYIFSYRFGIKKGVAAVSFQNIDFWFKKDVQEKLAVIRSYIYGIEDEGVRNFFKVAFSESVRSSSLTKKGEFKLVRINQDKLNDFSPDVFGLMETKLSRNRLGLKKYLEEKKDASLSKIFDFNTVHCIPAGILPDCSADIVITSPPYGDSRTTVAYGQFSRLANQWLGMMEASRVDKSLMGGCPVKQIPRFDIKPLDASIERISYNDEKRALDVASFYLDYIESIKNVSKVVKRGGIAAYVVGNRRVTGVELPTDDVTRRVFELEGYRHLETIVRSIPSKRMPFKNSPTNEPGNTQLTIHNEYIVLMKKNNKYPRKNIQ